MHGWTLADAPSVYPVEHAAGESSNAATKELKQSKRS